MVGCDHITQKRENLCALDIGDDARILGHALEVRRVLDVGRSRGPVVDFLLGHFHALPLLVTLEHVRIFRLERFACDCLLDQFCHFLCRGPDVFQVDVLAIRRLRDGVGCKVDVHRACNRIGHHEGGRGEVVGAHIRADTSFKVAVARQDRSRNQIAFMDRGRKFCLKRTRVADAGRATISNKVKAKRIKINLKLCSFQIGGHNLRARCERCLDPRFAVKTQSCRFARNKARADHDVWVGCVGARRNGSDNNFA